MYRGKEYNAGGDPLCDGLGIAGRAQLITDDDLRVHAAQRHGNALGLGAAGVDIAPNLRCAGQTARLTGHQLAALINDADKCVLLAELLRKRAQQGGLAAARRAGQQQPAGGGNGQCLQLGRQRTGQPARNAQIERRYGGKAARPAAARYPDAAAALHGEIPLLQLVLIGVDRAAAELQKAVPQGVGLQRGRQTRSGKKFGRGAQSAANRELYGLAQPQTDLLNVRRIVGIQLGQRCAQCGRQAFQNAVVLVHRFFTSHCQCMRVRRRVEQKRGHPVVGCPLKGVCGFIARYP